MKMKGYCKKCSKITEFEFIDEFEGLKKWRCIECGNIQIGKEEK